jgi:hypothetical protein
MTSHVGRLYAIALALFVFFLTWTAVGARPWASTSGSTKPDLRVTALVVREQRLRRESLAVQKLVKHRWAVYRVELRKRQSQIQAAHRAQLAAASAPSVRVVNLPPLTITRTS